IAFSVWGRLKTISEMPPCFLSNTESSEPGMACLCSETLEDGGNALPAPDAHRDQRVASTGAVEFVDGLGHDDRAGRADGMAQRDARAVRVDFRRVETQLSRHRTGLRGKGLVRLDDVEVLNAETATLEHPSDRWDRTDS